METGKEYLNFILDQLSGLEDITHRAMMGEYILYYNSNAPREPPYNGAKDMILVENADDRVFLEMLFRTMDPESPEPKLRKRA